MGAGQPHLCETLDVANANAIAHGQKMLYCACVEERSGCACAEAVDEGVFVLGYTVYRQEADLNQCVCLKVCGTSASVALENAAGVRCVGVRVEVTRTTGM